MSTAARFAELMGLFGFMPQGVCPQCLSLIDIDDAGKITAHSASRWGNVRCLGAGQPPKLSAQAAAPQEQEGKKI